MHATSVPRESRRPFRFTHWLPLALALLLPQAQAAPANPDAFDPLAQAIETFKRDTRYPAGTAVIVVKDGKIAYQGYFGLADIAAKTAVDADTVFYIASATKPFFALNALLAEHAGSLDTRTSLQAMFPAARFDGFDASAVTLRHLLTHTAGIDNVALGWATAFSGVHDAASRQRLVLQSRANADAPLGTFDYTNIGYNIASVWRDRIDAKPWQAQLQARIFAPLKMVHTTARTSEAEARGWTIAKPYAFVSVDRSVPLYLRKTDATMHAAGGMLSTAPDLANFLIAQLDEGKLDRKQVLPASVIDASQQQQAVTDSKYLDFPRDGYAWGWYTGDYKGRRMLHHFGGFAGFHAHLSFMPDMDAGLVILHNEDTLAPKLSALIADAVYGTILGEPDVTARVERRLDGLLDRVAGLEAMVQTQRQQIEGRAWSLSLPMTAYAGSYAHPLLGAIHLSVEDGRPLLRWGRLAARATGYDGTDQARIEWVPNSGQVITFTVSDGRVQALSFDGMRFDRTEEHAAGTPPR